MTKRLLTTILALGCALLMTTQATHAQGFEVTARGGVNYASLVGIDGTTPKMGYYAGLGANIFFGEHWGIGSEATLSGQGVCCEPNEAGVAMNYHYDYLNVPLLLHFQFELGKAHTLRFSAGAQMGLFLVGRYDYTAPSIFGEGLLKGSGELDKESFHPVDFGASLGAQWILWERVALEVRYTLGITQTHNGISNTLNDYYHISVPDNRNSVLQIGAAFSF